MSYYFGGVGKYHFGNGFALTVQLHFRIIPKSITQNNTSTRQSYNLVNLDLGVEYEF